MALFDEILLPFLHFLFSDHKNVQLGSGTVSGRIRTLLTPGSGSVI
jgi:hypothetical protein